MSWRTDPATRDLLRGCVPGFLILVVGMAALAAALWWLYK
jgi:hypothetical protein